MARVSRAARSAYALMVLRAIGWLIVPGLVRVAAAQQAAVDHDAPPAGFATLFNGTDLDGWKGGATADPRKISAAQQQTWNDDVPRHWRVESGELVSDGHEPHLVTERDYGDFELWVDWKLQPCGDSGVYLRSCPQVQIWDPSCERDLKFGCDKGSGGLWNNERQERFPLALADKPLGEWNRMFIRMVGEHVTVVLNDTTVVDGVVLENYYDRKIPVFARGPIQLQTHGSEMRFRRVCLREIPAEEADKLLETATGGEAGFEPVFNGRDFAGWIGATESYEIVDGGLRCWAGAGGNLLTAQEYDDFAVRLEFKLPPGGNNGLAIRTPGPDADAAYEGIELQVLDDGDAKFADLHDYQSHGSAYGLAAAHRGYLRPPGQWNYEEAVVQGDRVQVRLNGVEILDVDLAEARERPLDGKAHPGAARRTGHFGFCGHSDPVEFRNIRIKRLGR